MATPIIEACPEDNDELNEKEMSYITKVFVAKLTPEASPQRPGHKVESFNDDFMMDFENNCLSCWDTRKGIPKGRKRYENNEWATLIKSKVYPHHSDIDWDEYVAWVSQGGGDEWFEEECPDL